VHSIELRDDPACPGGRAARRLRAWLVAAGMIPDRFLSSFFIQSDTETNTECDAENEGLPMPFTPTRIGRMPRTAFQQGY
jgi:hypothetical protein